MAAKKKTNRPKAYQVRLEDADAAAFEKLVARRARETGGAASATSVLRGLVWDALVAEGLRSRSVRAKGVRE